MSGGADYTNDEPRVQAGDDGFVANSRGIYEFWLKDLEYAKRQMSHARKQLRTAQERVAAAKAWADADEEYEAAFAERQATRLDINAPSWTPEQAERARAAELRLVKANYRLDQLMDADLERKKREQKTKTNAKNGQGTDR